MAHIRQARLSGASPQTLLGCSVFSLKRAFRCTVESTASRNRFRAQREQPNLFSGLLPESQGRNLAVTVLYMPTSRERSAAPSMVYRHPPLSRSRPEQGLFKNRGPVQVGRCVVIFMRIFELRDQPRTWRSLSVFWTLSRSLPPAFFHSLFLSFSLSRSLALSFPVSLSLTPAHSLPLSLPLFLGQGRRIPGKAERDIHTLHPFNSVHGCNTAPHVISCIPSTCCLAVDVENRKGAQTVAKSLASALGFEVDS